MVGCDVIMPNILGDYDQLLPFVEYFIDWGPLNVLSYMYNMESNYYNTFEPCDIENGRAKKLCDEVNSHSGCWTVCRTVQRSIKSGVISQYLSKLITKSLIMDKD